MPGPHIHTVDPQYAEPLLRAPSPSSSIGTDYGEDETSITDAQMSPEEFDALCQERLMLSMPREGETRANISPLLPKPKTPQEERVLHMKVMHSLRAQVARLQEDEMFERTMLRGTMITEQQLPSSNDIDSIMQSMMGPSSSSRSTTAEAPSTSIPPPLFESSPATSNLNAKLFGVAYAVDHDSESSGTTVGKRPSRSVPRARKI